MKRGGEHYIGKGRRKQQLCRELRAYEKAGLQLLLDGRPSTPKEIAKACMIRDEENYMRDYIRGDSEKIIGIGFDLIKDS